uniref:Uncharacterized protein n=1 Tax=Oryza sativa subsp. japonica TaxID=39947 RepID=Q84QP1_ORYSJ|nr:hypothetical protein [Oryza sativa Japonica Group]BAD03036.1 hypothetical protein [Oryza sativa Japonica Group]
MTGVSQPVLSKNPGNARTPFAADNVTFRAHGDSSSWNSRCYGLSLSDEQLADLAFQGLSAAIRERFFCHEFDNHAHLMQIVSAHESRLQEAKEY